MTRIREEEDWMRSYFLVGFALIIVCIICYIHCHSFDVPRYKYDLTRKSFIFMCLYNYR